LEILSKEDEATRNVVVALVDKAGRKDVEKPETLVQRRRGRTTGTKRIVSHSDG
jgi:hypothetical protein